MTQLIEMTQIGFLSNESTPYPPRQYMKSLRQLPDTSQTPSRHPTDTPKYDMFWLIWGSWDKRSKLMSQMSNWVFINCLHIISPQTVSRVTQTTPDTSQTPSRHPTDTLQYGTFWPIQGNWEKRNQLIYISLIGCLSIACTSYPPRQYPKLSKTPRHLSDTFQTTFRHYEAPGREVFQQIKITLIGKEKEPAN